MTGNSDSVNACPAYRYAVLGCCMRAIIKVVFVYYTYIISAYIIIIIIILNTRRLCTCDIIWVRFNNVVFSLVRLNAVYANV